MSKNKKIIITFIISFIIAFFVVGYAKSNIGVAICWVENVTIWDKFEEYYIRTFSLNLIPAFIIASISSIIVYRINRNKGFK